MTRRPTDVPFDDDDDDDDEDEEDVVDDEDEDEDDEEEEGNASSSPEAASKAVPSDDDDGEDDDAPIATGDDDPRFSGARGFVDEFVVPVVDAEFSVDGSVAAGCVVVGSGLAAALAVAGRGTGWVDEREGAGTPGTALSDEEKLLRAIFGEAAEPVVEKHDVGAVRGATRLIKTPADGDVWFTAADEGVVEGHRTERRKKKRGASFTITRHLVDVRWHNPIGLGDVVVDADGVCAVVAGFVRSDGRVHPSPWSTTPPTVAQVRVQTATEWRSRRVDELELAPRTAKALDAAGIVTIADLTARTEAWLLKTNGIGRRSLKEIKELLQEIGLSLGMPPPAADVASVSDDDGRDEGGGADVERDGPRFLRAATALRGPFTVERPTARERLEARGIGPYTDVLRRPATGVVVDAAQRRALRSRAPLAADEVAWRADDDDGRARLYETLVKGEDPRDEQHRRGSGAASTRAVQMLDALLTVLGFGVDVEPAGFRLRCTAVGRALPPSHEASAPETETETTTTTTTTTTQTGPARDIFSFFERPKAQQLLQARRSTSPWSFGEVKKPETLNYRTFKPERDGLFCERIFGPVVDYECACKKYKRMKHRGIVCEKCGVEVIQSRVRAERFGHIPLAHAVVPPHLKPLLARRLGVDAKGLDRLIEAACEDVGALVGRVNAVVDAADVAVPTRACLWTVLPVLPPTLRPMLTTPGGGFLTSDLNDLYRRAINRNNRLRRLVELNAPEIILANERRHLQETVAELVGNTRLKKPVRGPNKRPLVDVAAWIPLVSGERVRVDYGAAAVCVVDDALDDGCLALGRAIATELYKPNAYALLEQRGFVTTIKSAKRMIEADKREARDAIDDACRDVGVYVAHADVVAGARVVAVDDGAALRVARSLAVGLGVQSGDTIAVHRALSAAASAELLALPPTRAPATSSSSNASFASSGWIQKLLDAVRGGGDVGGVLVDNVDALDGGSDAALALWVRNG